MSSDSLSASTEPEIVVLAAQRKRMVLKKTLCKHLRTLLTAFLVTLVFGFCTNAFSGEKISKVSVGTTVSAHL